MKANKKFAEYFGRILDNSFNEIYVFDANGLNFIQMNFGARKNLGYSKDELTGLTPLDLKPEYTRETFEELIEPLRLKQKPLIIFETVHKRKDGTSYPVEVRLQLMHDEPPPVFVAIVRDMADIKKMKEQETKLLSIIENTSDAVVALSLDGIIETWNPAAEKIFGYKPEEIIGENIQILIPSNKKKEAAKLFETLKNNGEVSSVETTRLKKDGNEIHISITSSPIKDEGGKLIGISGISRDISDFKKADEELRQRRNELEQKNFALKEILSQIEIEKKQITDSVARNSERLLLPLISKLRKKDANGNKKIYDLLERNLKELTSEFGGKVLGGLIKLSPKELEICNLIKNGFESKEISSFLNISPKTVDTHRRNVRHKLGIANKEINLTSYLNSI